MGQTNCEIRGRGNETTLAIVPLDFAERDFTNGTVPHCLSSVPAVLFSTGVVPSAAPYTTWLSPIKTRCVRKSSVHSLSNECSNLEVGITFIVRNTTISDAYLFTVRRWTPSQCGLLLRSEKYDIPWSVHWCVAQLCIRLFKNKSCCSFFCRVAHFFGRVLYRQKLAKRRCIPTGRTLEPMCVCTIPFAYASMTVPITYS